ncbi:MAG: tol-pal system protein YbgF [Polyangia bacterium]
MREQISELERELTRLEAEKANLAARSSELDDELVLCRERVEDRSRRRHRQRELEVVRIGPGRQSAALQHEPPEPEEVVDDGEGERPVLRLVGNRSPGGSGGGGGPLPPVPTVRSGESLGVAPLDGGANGAAASASSGPMDQFHEAYRAYSNKRYERALEVFAGFLREHPDHEYADNALFWRGECYLARGRLLKAVGEFERVLRRYPGSEKTPSALYRIGFVYDQLRDRSKARHYYFKVVERHPGTEAARRASRRVAALGGDELGGELVTTAVER